MANTENNIKSEFWSKVEKDFIKSDLNIKDFAESKELVYSTVYKWSRRNNWIKKREKIKQENLLSGKVDFDAKCASALLKGLAIIDKAVAHGIDARSTPALMRCIRDIQEGMYRLMDIPLPKQRIENENKDDTPRDNFKDFIMEQIRALQPQDLMDTGYTELNQTNGNNGVSENGNGKDD